MRDIVVLCIVLATITTLISTEYDFIYTQGEYLGNTLLLQDHIVDEVVVLCGLSMAETMVTIASTQYTLLPLQIL